jgi:hypothetical protein
MPPRKTKGLDIPAPLTLTIQFNSDYPLPILNIFVPQLGQVPCVAGFPFFILIALESFISFLDRHFTQYPCIFSPLFACIEAKLL